MLLLARLLKASLLVGRQQDALVEVTPTIVETRQIATIALIQSNHSNRTQENGVRIFKGPSVSATKNLNGFDRMDEIKREGKE